MAQIQAPNMQLADQDNTATQGFESAAKNVIPIDQNDCLHCLKPYLGRGPQGNRINIFTAHGKDQWCAECVEKGTKEGICVQESKLTKKQKKIWEKKLKKEKKASY